MNHMLLSLPFFLKAHWNDSKQRKGEIPKRAENGKGDINVEKSLVNFYKIKRNDAIPMDIEEQMELQLWAFPNLAECGQL